jgi:PilZ domain-containing protein
MSEYAMPPVEKRKTTRRALRYPAMIEPDDGSALIRCELCDASREGAQLHIDDPNGVPDEFTLLLGYDGTARRRCKVIWRTESQIGVEFKKMPQATVRSNTQTAHPAGDAEPDDSFDIDSLSSR